ncbi:ABC transporter substrate-binding protein [Paenibacillus eucommiae]|uniref:ABC-type glycerol-3-phosphate transport system substrate-binding protein n=1 Tax=Paenibacillus eucommiae TaxID=1355755 RepID=A0ABS4IXT7_9BACL|nr:extracellular solute-binding protein [Paenibacillus eucommiae]MBP1991801.1 ABC-type glycerol-3-phosphate transport system substrate-binding protein [Paenibacillus eucommiae]
MTAKWSAKRYFVLVVGIILVLSVFLSACSSEKEPEGSTGPIAVAPSDGGGKKEAAETVKPEEKHEPVTLKLVTWNNTYDDLYKKFTAKYPWITIEPIYPANGLDTSIIEKIAALQAAGTPADLTWLTDLSQYTKGGLLEDLKPYIEKDESLKSKKLPQGFFESFDNAQGQRYAIPFVDVPMWVMVNMDLLAKYGLEMPGNDWTYDKFRELAKAATDPAAGEYGLTNSGIFAQYFLSAMSVANGNSPNLWYMNEDLTQSVLDKPEAMNDVKWIQEFMTKDGSLPGNNKTKELGGSVGNFINGKTLFMIGGDFILEPLQKEAKFKFDVLPFPKGKVTQVTHHIYGPIGLLSSSKHKEEAWKWISFQFEAEAQKWKIDHGSNAFVIDDELKAYIDESPLWQGKNTEAVKMTKDMCCIGPGPTIPVFQENPFLSVADIILSGGDLNSLKPRIEAWNKKTLELRKAVSGQ